MDRLSKYRSKRDFTKTPEPLGSAGKGDAAGGLFVIHKHAATRLHFDLRLEVGGVLRSWALPKGPSLRPGERRLALEVEDHPLKYGDFEGVIPEGEYGGGTVMLWDRGNWRAVPKRAKADRLEIELEGEKLRGRWTLVRMASGSEAENAWLMIKRDDGEVTSLGELDDRSVETGRTIEQIRGDGDAIWSAGGDTGRAERDLFALDSVAGARPAPLPDDPRPQLAAPASEAPAGEDFLHEIKFDGYRVMARLDRGDVTLLSRNGQDWRSRFPHLARALERLGVATAVLDGEVVALAPEGVSSFRMLQEAISTGRTSSLRYYLFDLVYLSGFDLSHVPLVQRKELLRRLLGRAGAGNTGHLRYTGHLSGQGPAFFDQACRLGLEGIVSKKASSRYTTGRSKTWLKAKCSLKESFVVGGYSAPGGARSGFGALLLGSYAGEMLDYAGKVGSGFSKRQLRSLHATLQALERPTSPFRDLAFERGVRWVEPVLVVEVEFTERTADGRLRHPTFLGLREDVSARDIESGAGAKGAHALAVRANAKRERSDRQPGKRHETAVAGVRLSNPDRILYPEQGVTKLALAEYYADVWQWVAPELRRRPLSLVRCPQGHSGQCFYQKHPGDTISANVPRVTIQEKGGAKPYVYVDALEHLIALVQLGTLELHPWGSRVDDLESPDALVFDLDPAPNIPWLELLRVARELKERLAGLGLSSFVRTTGGKGLHVVVPVAGGSWPQAKAFARAVAQQHASDEPAKLTTNMSKSKRQGRIFLDYLRNQRGATAIASYSTRARPGAPVAVPVRWDELGVTLTSDRYSVGNARRRLSALKEDPWARFDAERTRLTQGVLERLGIE